MFEDAEPTAVENGLSRIPVPESAAIWNFLLPCCYPTSAPTTYPDTTTMINIYEAAHKYGIFRAQDAAGKLLLTL
jgi:hypothetical protein